jgi:DNA-directed RNA polymerase specialized sigma24 family protein
MPAAAVATVELAMASEKDLLDLGGPAWRTAVRALGRSEGAEDVVQEALLAAVKQLRAGPPPEDLRT